MSEQTKWGGLAIACRVSAVIKGGEVFNWSVRTEIFAEKTRLLTRSPNGSMTLVGSWAERTMIDTELLRAICKELITEKDSVRLEELLSLVCAVMRSDQEEAELKLQELSKRYPSLKKTRAPEENKDGRNKKTAPAIGKESGNTCGQI